MGCLGEILKKVFSIKLPEHFHFHLSFFTLAKIDQSKKVEYNDSSNKVSVNLKEITSEEKKKVKELLLTLDYIKEQLNA